MQHLKNIDSAFKHVRIYTMVIIISYTALLGFVFYCYIANVDSANRQIYIISGGAAMKATASTRKDNLTVEAKDHIQRFHELFFTLSPDEKAINANMRAAFYMADRTAKNQYDDLKEKGYYNGIIGGNISQQLRCDSVTVNTNTYPYYWRFYGRQQIIRPTALLERSLITEGYLREVERTDHNPHGFLMERWTTLENKDLSLQKR